MSELLHCPFCGGKAVINEEYDLFQPGCTCCDCDLGYFYEEEQAIREWNERTEQ